MKKIKILTILMLLSLAFKLSATSLTQVVATQCNQTVTDLSGYFYCDAVTGAQDYEWEFTNTTLSYSYTRIRGAATTSIPRTWILGLQFGKTYDVRVRIKTGGVWGVFGNTCSITIGTTIPLTQVDPSQCGQTVSDLCGYFYCNGVVGADDYEWEFTNTALGYSYTRARGAATTSIPRTWILGLQFGKTYDVKVRTKVGGVWGTFGSACTITIGTTVPLTQVDPSQCGQTVSDLCGYFYCNTVCGAEDYEW